MKSDRSIAPLAEALFFQGGGQGAIVHPVRSVAGAGVCVCVCACVGGCSAGGRRQPPWKRSQLQDVLLHISCCTFASRARLGARL